MTGRSAKRAIEKEVTARLLAMQERARRNAEARAYQKAFPKWLESKSRRLRALQARINTLCEERDRLMSEAGPPRKSSK